MPNPLHSLFASLTLFELMSLVPTAAKYLLPQRGEDLVKKFLEASDWFTAYNSGKIFNMRKVVLI